VISRNANDFFVAKNARVIPAWLAPDSYQNIRQCSSGMRANNFSVIGIWFKQRWIQEDAGVAAFIWSGSLSSSYFRLNACN